MDRAEARKVISEWLRDEAKGSPYVRESDLEAFERGEVDHAQVDGDLDFGDLAARVVECGK